MLCFDYRRKIPKLVAYNALRQTEYRHAFLDNCFSIFSILARSSEVSRLMCSLVKLLNNPTTTIIIRTGTNKCSSVSNSRNALHQNAKTANTKVSFRKAGGLSVARSQNAKGMVAAVMMAAAIIPKSSRIQHVVFLARRGNFVKVV